MTRTEYTNTVRDLLNDTSNPAAAFPPEEDTKGFLNNADAYTTTDLHVEDWMTAAEQIAANARSKGTFDLQCAKDAETCAKDFIRSFGLKAFRRPLEDDEVASYYTRFQQGATGTFAEGLEWVVGRMLQSPSFLYRLELDASAAPAGKAVLLSDYSLASRLSYFLWQTMPDDVLFDSAAKGKLATAPGVEAEVVRMIKDPRFESTLTSFHDQWIGLGQVVGQQKANSLTPAWDANLQSDLLTEADLFVKDVYDNGRSAKDLLTGQFSYISPLLAQFYGVEHPTGSGFVRVDQLPHRYGLLTMPAILAVQAHPEQTAPVKRGKLVREQIICGTVPDPPNNFKIVIPEVKPGQTTRQRFEAHRTQASCATCHTLLDPLGVPLENYDEFGRYRETDQGLPVDPRGSLTGTSATDPAISSPEEYGQKLAALPEVQNCFVSEWFRYAAGHVEEKPDACTIADLRSKFQTSGQNLRELLIQIATSDGFRYRVNQ